MASIALTINGQTVTRNFPDSGVIAVLTALGEQSGLPPTDTVAKRVVGGFDAMLADAVTSARAYRRAQKVAQAEIEVETQVGWEAA